MKRYRTDPSYINEWIRVNSEYTGNPKTPPYPAGIWLAPMAACPIASTAGTPASAPNATAATCNIVPSPAAMAPAAAAPARPAAMHILNPLSTLD